MYLADAWQDYEILDAGNGNKLERWGQVRLLRPDPQAVLAHAGAPVRGRPLYPFRLRGAAIGNTQRPCPIAGPSNTGT